MNTGRNFIGIEIDPGYHAIAERRIREAKDAAESKLFAATA
jgi:DNA modification methylase